MTWWMVETYGLDAERLTALADSGPGHYGQIVVARGRLVDPNPPEASR